MFYIICNNVISKKAKKWNFNNFLKHLLSIGFFATLKTWGTSSGISLKSHMHLIARSYQVKCWILLASVRSVIMLRRKRHLAFVWNWRAAWSSDFLFFLSHNIIRPPRLPARGWGLASKSLLLIIRSLQEMNRQEGGDTMIYLDCAPHSRPQQHARQRTFGSILPYRRSENWQKTMPHDCSCLFVHLLFRIFSFAHTANMGRKTTSIP